MKEEEKPLLDDLFNYGGTTEDGVSYDGWLPEEEEKESQEEPKPPKVKPSRISRNRS